MSSVRFGVIVFPGSNCDHDAHYVTGALMGHDSRLIWHKESSLGDVDVVVLPGGFSYGDYLRCGAIARFSPIMKEVVRFAQAGGRVIGICNGFQVLTESGLLPGVLLRNSSLRFVCKYVHLTVERTDTMWTNACIPGQTLEIPVAHGDGNYFAEPDTYKRLKENGQIVFRYASSDGQVSGDVNPNGSLDNIAGIMNEQGNVLGMMPHPERASDESLGHTDGRRIFESIVTNVLSDMTQEQLADASRRQ